MDNELTHAQLVDETAPTIDTLRRNIRIARKLAVHMNRPTCRYDHALSALAELEADMNTVAQEALEHDSETEGEEVNVW